MLQKSNEMNVIRTKSSSKLETQDCLTATTMKQKPAANVGRSWGLRSGLRLLSGNSSHVSGSSTSTKCSIDPSVESLSCEFSLRGILKTSNTYGSEYNDFVGPGRTKEKKKLRFQSSRNIAKVYKIDSHILYSDDIWWSREEIDAHKMEQSDFRTASSEVKTVARNYLKAVRKGRIDITEHFSATSSSSTSSNLPQHFDNCEGTLTESSPIIGKEIHNALLCGRSYGFAGLELYAKSTSEKRGNVKTIISNVVSAYHSKENFGSKASEIEQKISTYARSLTIADRYWAVVVAKVDEEGANTNSQ